MLRNSSTDHVEEAEAQFQDGVLECKFRRFSPEGGLIQVETVKARSGTDQVELLRKIWKVEGPERISFHHLNRHKLEQSYRQSNED